MSHRQVCLLPHRFSWKERELMKREGRGTLPKDLLSIRLASALKEGRLLHPTAWTPEGYALHLAIQTGAWVPVQLYQGLWLQASCWTFGSLSFLSGKMEILMSLSAGRIVTSQGHPCQPLGSVNTELSWQGIHSGCQSIGMVQGGDTDAWVPTLIEEGATSQGHGDLQKLEKARTWYFLFSVVEPWKMNPALKTSCAYIRTCVFAGVYVGTCIWRAEVNFNVIPQAILSTFYLRQNFHWPETPQAV